MRLVGAPPPPVGEFDVATEASVSVLGRLPLDSLVDALADSPRVVPWEADVVVAVVDDERSLHGLAGWLRECGVVAPVWVVHGGTQGPAPGADAVRGVMRDAGYGALVMSRVSATWSATRFAMPA
ncbi:hypothetical protein M3147_12190 [Agromyces mediolanus]|uniref:hypothetical protein n=1 Tax=Agromyces mediolanus TaxID=41986 RepID=UPI00204109BC|nr:hypothetical protein [Agromyces mediolanus]MCM3658011.1 hypothetical protein [Agromyces mediolanus]